MSDILNFNRRHFLKSAGMTALAGAVGTGASAVAVTSAQAAAMKDGKFDFDEIYDR